MPSTETARHRELKRLALIWAQTHGYRIAACEVSVPTFRSRFDVAAYRPGKKADAPGATVIFECKQSRADFLKDSRCRQQIAARLAKLYERRALYEGFLRARMPSLRNGDALFPEFDSCRFEASGYAPYDKLTQELRTLSGRLHAQTKFSDLYRWQAANVHYVVADEAVAAAHELPYGWGLLIPQGDELRVSVEPTWQDVSDPARLALLQCIALAGTRAVHQAMGVTFPFPGFSPTASPSA